MAQAQTSAYTSRDTATKVTVSPRSKVRNAQKLGGVAINDDYTYLNKGELPANATNDAIFNASYQTKGLQPQGLQKSRRSVPAANEAEHDQSNNFEANRQLQAQGRAAQVEQQAKKKKALALKLAARIRASAVNLSVFAWATPLWAAVQLPAAILSIITFAIAGTVNAFLSSSNVIVSAATWIAEKALAGVGMLFGLDINLIKMADGLFLITYSFVLALGFFTLMIIYLQYTMALLRPLSGEGSGLKMGMFLLAIVGYSLPLLNLFPWTLLWMAAVWKYPR